MTACPKTWIKIEVKAVPAPWKQKGPHRQHPQLKLSDSEQEIIRLDPLGYKTILLFQQGGRLSGKRETFPLT